MTDQFSLDLSYHRLLVASRHLMGVYIHLGYTGEMTGEESVAAARAVLRTREAVSTTDLAAQLTLAAEFERTYRELSGTMSLFVMTGTMTRCTSWIAAPDPEGLVAALIGPDYLTADGALGRFEQRLEFAGDIATKLQEKLAGESLLEHLIDTDPGALGLLIQHRGLPPAEGADWNRVADYVPLVFVTGLAPDCLSGRAKVSYINPATSRSLLEALEEWRLIRVEQLA